MMLPMLYKTFFQMQHKTINLTDANEENISVRDIMTTDLPSSYLHTSLDEIASTMLKYNCDAIPVVSNDSRPIGMITDRDIAIACTLNHKAPWQLEASTVIGNRSLYICSKDDDIDIALAMMRDRKLRHLAVTDNNFCLVGVLSIDDVVGHSNKNKLAKELSYDDAMNTLKAVAFHH